MSRSLSGTIAENIEFGRPGATRAEVERAAAAVGAHDAIAALAAFVIVGSLTVGGAVAFDLVGGARARAALEELRTWLEANNATVMTVLFLVFGIVLVAKGLELLSG